MTKECQLVSKREEDGTSLNKIYEVDFEGKQIRPATLISISNFSVEDVRRGVLGIFINNGFIRNPEGIEKITISVSEDDI